MQPPPEGAPSELRALHAIVRDAHSEVSKLEKRLSEARHRERTLSQRYENMLLMYQGQLTLDLE